MRRADHSSRGELLTMVRRCVITKPRECGGSALLGDFAPKTKRRASMVLFFVQGLVSAPNRMKSRVCATQYVVSS